MKELLKHYKEIKHYAKGSTKFVPSLTGIDGARGYDEVDNTWEYQKEQLELEDLLFNHWYRNADKDVTLNGPYDLNKIIHAWGDYLMWQSRAFNEWLDEQLKDL